MSVTKISFSIRSILGEEVLRSPRNVNYTSLQRERPNNQSNLLSEEIVIPRSRSPLLHRCDGNRFVNLHASPIRAPQNTIESENIPPHINFPGLPQRFPDIQEQFQMAAIFVQRQAENEFPSSAKFSSHLSHCTHSCCRHRKIIPHGFPRSKFNFVISNSCIDEMMFGLLSCNYTYWECEYSL